MYDIEACGALENLLGKYRLVSPVIVAAYAVYSLWYGLWGAFSLLCLCGLCVSGARLLLSLGLQWRLRRSGQPTVGGGDPQKYARYTALTLLALLVVQCLVSPDTPGLLASRWYLLLVTPLLGMAFHFIGTSRAELSEALADTQINYAQGAAWGFFLSYLRIIFGQDQDNDSSITDRINDYLTSNSVDDQGPCLTYRRRLVILVPMKRETLLSDKACGGNDPSVKKEKKLKGIKDGGRTYGQTQVYTIKHEGRHYRVAMEEATPIRTAALAVEDSAVPDFDDEDFEEFVRRFLTALQKILRSKPGIRDQVELVPIEDVTKIGRTVVQRILKLKNLEEGTDDQRQEQANELTADGSVAAGQIQL